MRAFTVFSRMAYSRSSVATSGGDVGRVSWRKSSFSNLNGNCVEAGRRLPDRIGVRATKANGSGPVLAFTDAEWAAFVAGVKEGEFDNL